MGMLKPDTTYIYERSGGVIYSREFGSDPSTRKVIGCDYPNGQEVLNNGIWDDVLKEAKTNPALQKALEHVILLYRLSKDNPL